MLVVPAVVTLAGSDLFLLEFLPEKSIRKSVIIIPPFAEEMNRCRRMVWEQGCALAARGFHAVVPDLHGTGDSAGDFGEARWETWCENLVAVVHRATQGDVEGYGLLAIRLGALLALDPRADIARNASRIVLWNPCTSGRLFLKQFLRLRVASQLLSGSEERESMAGLMDRLKAGRSVEVAGYELSSQLALAIDASELELAGIPASVPITLFETGSMKDHGLSQAVSNFVHQWQGRGVNLHGERVHGDQFWGTAETAIVPALIEKTTRTFGSA